MKRLLLILLILLSCRPALSAFKHIPQGASEQILQESKEGQTLILNRRYDEAKKHFEKLSSKYPQSPLGTFGLMGLYNAKMFENYDFSLDNDFRQAQALNHDLIEKIAKQEDASSWDYFLCGASSGLNGFYFMRRDKALKAMGEANRAKKCLEKAYKKDPQFHDISLGLGMYDYWRSVFTNRIKFLPFPDRRQQGIVAIQKAVDQGSIANDLARAALMFVYLQENNAKAGLALAEQMDQTYPNNVIILTNKGDFLSRLRRHPEAQATFDKILQIDPKITVVLYFKGIDFERAAKPKEAKQAYEAYLKTNPTEAWQAYTYYRLGTLALRDKQRNLAMQYFKSGYKAYGDDPANLKMLLKLRQEKK